VYGSLDPAKDASPRQERQIMPLMLVACACLVRPLTSFPSWSFLQRTSGVTGALVDKSGAPACVADQPKLSIFPIPREGCRLPEERDAFHRRYNRMWLRRDHSLRPHASASRSRRPHFFPRLGRVFCLGFASITGRSPADRDVSYFERRAPLQPAG
jgi:hypothetical protein